VGGFLIYYISTMISRFFILAGIFLFISCTDSERNEPEDQSNGWKLSDITGANFTKKVKIEAGANIGSFLDIDGTITRDGSGAPMRYKQNEVAGNQNEIDLIYDGVNLWTPKGCITAPDDSPCPFKTDIDSSNSMAEFYNVADNARSADAKSLYYSLVNPANSAGYVQTYAPHGIYFIQTSTTSRALILANAEANNVVELIIGYIY